MPFGLFVRLMPRQLPITLLALLAAVLLAPAAAQASPKQVMTFEAPFELLDDGAREPTLDEIQSFGVTRVRALVYWRDFTARPNRKRKPRFNRAYHTRYPAGTWDRLDRLVASATRRGVELQLTLTGPVPTWATKRKRGHLNTPGAKEFGRWVKAVARRYGDRVHLWSIWNEPNHPAVPEAAVRQERRAALAADLPQALPRGRAGAARRARRPPRQGAVRRDRADRQPEPRLAARLPAQGDLPEPELRQDARLREAADRRLRPPRLHAQGRPDVPPRGHRRRQHRRARPAGVRARPRGPRRRRSTATGRST